MPEMTGPQMALIAALIVVQVTLMVIALVILFRTPTARLTAPRPVWLLVCFVQFVGPITFLLLGRKPAPQADQRRSPQSATVEQVVDELYGRNLR